MVSRKVAERWNAFLKQREESLLLHKGELFIIIYGAYSPPSDDYHLGGKERLIKLRDNLRNDGYTDTYIVADIPYDTKSVTPNLDKSYHCLECADLNILVFTWRGNTDSVTSELEHAIKNNLLSKCIVVEECNNGIPTMGTLPREKLGKERFSIAKVEYENDDDLYEHVLGYVVPFLLKHFENSK